jgi:eukaryotic-like serine/threonine-protein kinase
MPGSNLPAPDARAGRKLGKYEILSRLSTGGMSEIFLAFQRGLGGFRKIVVLKQILPDIKGEEEFVRMFLDEAKITGMFAHPNIAQVFDLDIADGELFLAMEFVPGATLVEVARACRQANEPIPIGFTLMAVRDTALALNYAHCFTDPGGRSLTVVHRDIAEKNIMVTFEGVTKLLDFGIAKNPDWSNRTSIGMVKGTSGYMSPEQITGQKLDGRTDIFSLGVVFHECLTGMRLFPSKSSEDSVLAVLREDAHPPSRLNKAIPPEIDAVVLKALARNRDERYGSALELARDIERASGGSLWLPEQTGALIKRFFADRRDQTRQLLDESASGETTGEVQLSELLARHDSQPLIAVTPSMSRAQRRPSSTEAQTDPGREAVSRPPLASRPTTRSRRRVTGQGNVAVSLEPKTVMDPPALPRMKTPPPPEVETILGEPIIEDLGELASGTTDAGPPPLPRFEPTDEATATARRSAVRRTAAPIALGALLALAVIGAGIWVWGPFRAASQKPSAPREGVAEAPSTASAGEHPSASDSAAPPVVAPSEAEPVKLEPMPEEPPRGKSTAPSATDVARAENSPLPGKKSANKGPRTAESDHRRKPQAKTPSVEPAPAKLSEGEGAPPDSPGQLSLDSEPRSTVVFKSQELGNTPLDHRSLPPGPHLLKLIDANGRAFRLNVDIKSGELTRLHVQLAELPSADGS